MLIVNNYNNCVYLISEKKEMNNSWAVKPPVETERHTALFSYVNLNVSKSERREDV